MYRTHQPPGSGVLDVVEVAVVGVERPQLVHQAVKVTVVVPLGGWVTVVTVGLIVLSTYQPPLLQLDIAA